MVTGICFVALADVVDRYCHLGLCRRDRCALGCTNSDADDGRAYVNSADCNSSATASPAATATRDSAGDCDRDRVARSARTKVASIDQRPPG